MIDIHEGHSEHFYKCKHGTLEDRKWLKRGKHFISLNTQLPICVDRRCYLINYLTTRAIVKSNLLTTVASDHI